MYDNDILYFTPPTDKEFDELKEKAVEVWEAYDDIFWYTRKKIKEVKELQNIGYNFMTIFGMFDLKHQELLIRSLSQETFEEIKKRLAECESTLMLI